MARGPPEKLDSGRRRVRQTPAHTPVRPRHASVGHHASTWRLRVVFLVVKVLKVVTVVKVSEVGQATD
eukprot:2465173-Prymnesium_polylepis.1